MNQGKDYNIAYAELVNRCWDDFNYLAKFKENPAAALEEFGIPTVPEATYHVVAPNDVKPSTEKGIYLPFQEKPGLRTLGDDMLDAAAGGIFISPHTNTTVIKNATVNDTVIAEAATTIVAVD